MHRFRRIVNHITGQRFGFGDDIGSGVKFSKMHNTVRIAYSILTDNAAIAARYLKGRACQRLAGLRIYLFNEQTRLFAVFDCKRVSFTLFQRYCMRGLVDDVTAGCGNLGYDVIRRVKALNECRTVLAGCDVLADNIAVGTGQLEHSTRQRLLRFGVDLGDRQTWLLGVLVVIEVALSVVCSIS